MTRSISDTDFDAKAIVARGYDECGAAYAAVREMIQPTWLALLGDRLQVGAAVLDIGCGSGIPVTRALAERFSVTGVDISAGQIESARRNVSRTTFVHGDIISQSFRPKSFAGVVMIYTLFHLPRQEQPELLRRIGAWLRPGGLLLVTLARTSNPGYIEDDFWGTSMYWSHFGEQEYYSIFKQVGFDILEKHQIGHGYGNVDREAEVHPLVLARKSKRPHSRALTSPLEGPIIPQSGN